MKQNDMPWDFPAISSTSSTTQNLGQVITGVGNVYSDVVATSNNDPSRTANSCGTESSGKRYGLAKPMRKFIWGDLKSDKNNG